MFRRLVLAVLVLLPLMAGSARAQEYEKPSWPGLLRTLVRFNALDLAADPLLVDEYAIVTDCELYKAFYRDDFKWNQVRQAVLKSVRMNIASYPMNYYYDVDLQLDRYDFASKTFRFTEKTVLKNVNTFMLFTVEGTDCGDANVKILPRHFRAILSSPVYLEGLPLAEQDAEALLKRMTDDGNVNRIVHARFNLRIVYIEPLQKTEIKTSTGSAEHYDQGAPEVQGLRLDARLDSIGFYEDDKMTKLLYEYQP